MNSTWLVGQNGSWGADEPRLLEATQAPNGSTTIWMNGISTGVAPLNLPTEVDRNQTFVGRSLYMYCPTFNGEIAEIILYARELSTEERQRVETYLASKWRCCDT